MNPVNLLLLDTLNPIGGFQNTVGLASGVEYGRTEISGTTYTGKATDLIIACMCPSSPLITLPPYLSNTFIIKDESGIAGTANIFISGSPNIDGVTGIAITTNYGKVTVYRSPYGWRTA